MDKGYKDKKLGQQIKRACSVREQELELELAGALSPRITSGLKRKYEAKKLD